MSHRVPNDHVIECLSVDGSDPRPRRVIPAKRDGSTRRPLRAICLACWVLSAGSVSAQNDLKDIPTPDPAAERSAMRLDESLDVNLFAGDPAISKPIQINFDAAGQLWVACSEVYPQIQPGEVADDKIIVLRDTDGDGVADQQRVFASGLLIPTGVVPDGVNACYVADSTQLIRLADTDGDGVADQRRVIFSGFGTEDTHHLIHTLRWGTDGHLYFNQSIYIHSHVDTADGTQRLDGGGVWRYSPRTGKLDVLCKGFINPWGHVQDAAGESFVTDGAFFEGINYVFPDAVFATSPGATRWLTGMNPGSPKFCGLEILSGTHVPPDYRGDLITHDFRSHRVCRFRIDANGAGYVSRQQPELLTTSHVAFRPIDVRMGPDGAIYVADWYNPIIQHGEVDFRDPRRDRKHGRVWRLSFKGRDADPWPALDRLDTASLLDCLDDASLAQRQFARETLWRRAADFTPADLQAIRQWRVDAESPEQVARRNLELLWLTEATGRDDLIDGTTADLLAATDASTERTTLRSLWRLGRIDDITSYQPKTDAGLLETIVCLGQSDQSQASDALVRILMNRLETITSQPDLDFAMWQSLRKRPPDWQSQTAATWKEHPAALAFAIQADPTPAALAVGIDVWTWTAQPYDLSTIQSRSDADAAPLPQLPDAVASKSADASDRSRRAGITAQSDALTTALLANADAAQLSQLLRAAVETPSADAFDRLRRIVDASRSRGLIPDDAAGHVTRAIRSRDLAADPSRLSAIAAAVAAWDIQSLESVVIQRVDAIIAAGDRSRVDPQWIQAIGQFRTPDSRRWLDEKVSGDDERLRQLAIAALVRSRPRDAVEPLVVWMSQTSDSTKAAELVGELVRRKELPPLLTQTITASQSRGITLAADMARAVIGGVQGAGGDVGLEAALRSAGGLDEAAWKLTPDLVEQLIAQVQTDGSADRGQWVYRRASLQCINCHAIGVGGGLVGPNLISLGGSSQLDYIIESLLEPNAKLKEGYTTLTILTDEGQVHSGIVIGQTDQSTRLRLADNTEIEIAADAIEDAQPGKSLMPAGLVDSLTRAELVDLIAFLRSLGSVPRYTVSTKPIVRELETLTYTNEANRVLNRTSLDSVASPHPDFTWRPLTTLVDGELPSAELDTFKQHQGTPPYSFVRFKVQTVGDNQTGIDIPAAGVDVWLDGKPTPPAGVAAGKLAPGVHEIVLGIDRDLQSAGFTIGLLDTPSTDSDPK